MAVQALIKLTQAQNSAILGVVIHFSENPDHGSATAPRLFGGTGAIRQMPSTIDPSWMMRPKSS
ncbi:MAG: hypothetical protein HC827_14935 [Cyanobacteria bacterium RM1_2_2]|nr:hypothetical protein [Cyanobacteria bacterium RM1_2_2]